MPVALNGVDEVEGAVTDADAAVAGTAGTAAEAAEAAVTALAGAAFTCVTSAPALNTSAAAKTLSLT